MASVHHLETAAPLTKGDILIVDDLCDNIDILRRQLERNDFNIEYVRDGEAALKHIVERCPDLVLLDWMMPRMSGLDALKKIRKSYSASHLPVIMITAMSETDCVVEAFEHGANDYIVKPFNAKVVLARVQSQIERLQALRTLENFMTSSNQFAALVGGDAFGQAVVVRDAIAARKAAEVSLRGALERAETATRAKKAFLSNMSHELRTPLNAILGFSSILYDEVDDKHQELVAHINKSGEHLLSILTSLIRMSELELNHPALQRAAVDAIELVDDALDILRFSANEKNIEFNFMHSVVNSELFADRVALKQALINVISNAIKFSPDGRRVDVKIEQLSVDRLAFVISDSGIGLPEEMLAKLGEPFERGDFDYEGCYDGIGLGLAIAKRLVEAHGGQLSFERREPIGAIVSLVMPQSTLNYLNE